MTRNEKFGYALLAVIAAFAIAGILYSLLPTGEAEERVGLQGEALNQPTITLVLREQESDFWETVRMGAEAAAKEFGANLTVTAMPDSDDSAGQIKLVRQALADKTRALVVAAADDGDMANAITGVRIPVIAIDTDINAGAVRSYIGIDNYDAGKKAGERIIEQLGEQGHVVILSSVKDDRNMEQRIRGILDTFKQASFITVLDNRYCMAGIEACESVTRSLMDATLVDGIVALNADAAIGAGRELIRRGEEDRVKVVAFESAHEELEMLQDGVLEATIVQNPFSMGYLGVKHAMQAMEGETIPPRVDIHTKIIDRDNMFWMDNQKILFPFVK
ncbi:substrate-binding domain-containing protein [Paenibacillus methanolicus]|uniref:Ribose transport system substrate-binding protein n=1 Tax=Paenibacillus methanolicus TaxID=582686 RepID=A0A5S5BUM8_9BACL|nr:substrate-binding domain-containing protein [Paenibacillus methanolicus]TYP70674.1 ribose transport system substrate-binding protein [Paenibacillus methanolicus]